MPTEALRGDVRLFRPACDRVDRSGIDRPNAFRTADLRVRHRARIRCGRTDHSNAAHGCRAGQPVNCRGTEPLGTQHREQPRCLPWPSRDCRRPRLHLACVGWRYFEYRRHHFRSVQLRFGFWSPTREDRRSCTEFLEQIPKEIPNGRGEMACLPTETLAPQL